jgi:hypothetical protein
MGNLIKMVVLTIVKSVILTSFSPIPNIFKENVVFIHNGILFSHKEE